VPCIAADTSVVCWLCTVGKVRPYWIQLRHLVLFAACAVAGQQELAGVCFQAQLLVQKDGQFVIRCFFAVKAIVPCNSCWCFCWLQDQTCVGCWWGEVGG
jgi:hypothetical protein